MGRLIDAGLFLDNLSGRLESMKDYDAVKDVINNMPTAYDVDKVVEQLEEGKKRASELCLSINDCAQRLKYIEKEQTIALAIEIVKGGGVDGN
jgi:hypothetical protein|nr:MAG TPA: Cyclin-dependent kinase 9 [Bacteriophage sp.]